MKISIVVPAHNEEENLPILIQRIRRAVDEILHEVLIVDDGSKDETLAAAMRESELDARVKYISFSRNFGHQAALRAGMQYASGDCVVTMDADLQHPPHLLPELIERWKDGYDVVLTLREEHERQSWFKKATSSAFYKMINMVSDVQIDPGSADFRLLDRKVVNAINALPESDFFLRGIVPWLGFRTFKLSYAPDVRLHGSTKYSIRRMISFAASGVVANSIHPLRIATLLAGTLASLTATYAIYALAVYFHRGDVVPGWTSVAMIVSLIGSLQLFVLGVLGEYVGRILRQTRDRPSFIVRTSNVDRAS